MFRNLRSLVLVATFASSVLATAQVPSSPTDASMKAPGSSTAAFVYVASANGNTSQIYAFTAASNGALTPVAGSPFAGNVSDLAVSSKYLFGANGVDIDSFSIASNGAVRQISSINAQRLNQGDCGGPVNIFLDRSGSTLYDLDYIGNICANNPYQFFNVESNGSLNYMGVTSAATPSFESGLSFIGNNKYGYNSSCYHWIQDIYGFARNSDGAIAELSITPTIPDARPGYFYCPYLGAADNRNDVAIPMQTDSAQTFQPDGPTQLAVYTADSSGNLTTNSTYENMPVAAVGASTIAANPAGNLLAVGGNGVQIFHFNGANPITKFTGPLGSEPISQVFWDNDNHLYAISNSAGKLYVYSVTTTTVTQAPGSPYSIASPESIAVLSEN